MNKFVLALLLVVPLWANAWTQSPSRPMEQCSIEAPYGFPSGKQGSSICRLAYATMVDNAAKLPVWTVWTITPTEAIGCHPRSNNFTADLSLPKDSRATPEDYTGTGYDRGHVAPDGDMSFDANAGYESFLMSNMMPQSGGLNRGIWKLVETYSRGWAVQRNTSVTVYAGPVYTMNNPTIGKNKVVVPHKFYKIVIDNKTKEVLAFLFEHKGGQGNDITTVQSTVAKIEAETGLKFPLPQGAVLNKSAKDFPVDFGALTNAKRAKCK